MLRPTTSGIKLSPKKAKKLTDVSHELAFLRKYVPGDDTCREEAIARKQNRHTAKDIRQAAILFSIVIMSALRQNGRENSHSAERQLQR
jgi:hypothetical protein